LRAALSASASGLCHQVCCAINIAEDLSCVPQELLADGGVLQKQRDYEENSWWFWWVDWWVHGMLSNTLVADQIAIMDKSISSGNKAT